MIDALSGVNNSRESKVQKSRESSNFNDFLGKMIGPTNPTPKFDADKTVRAHMVRHLATKKNEPKEVKQADHSKSVKSDKQVDRQNDDDKQIDSSKKPNDELVPASIEEENWDEFGMMSKADDSSDYRINNNILKILSEVLSMPPDDILMAMINLNIQPQMLQAQDSMEDLLFELQPVHAASSEAVSQAGLNNEMSDLSETTILSEPFDANNKQGIVAPENGEVQKTDSMQAEMLINVEKLTEMVKRAIYRYELAESDNSVEIPEEEGIQSIEASSIQTKRLENAFSEELEYEESIGESWHSNEAVEQVFNNEGESNFNHVPMQPENNSTSSISTTEANTQIRLEVSKSTSFHEVVRQVTDSIKTESLGRGVSELKVMLKPESLGEVALKLLSDNGIITARFVAENYQVKDIIESNFNTLHESLNAQGLNVSQLSVSVGNREEQNREFGSQAKHTPARIAAVLEELEEAPLPILRAQDSRVSYSA